VPFVHLGAPFGDDEWIARPIEAIVESTKTLFALDPGDHMLVRSLVAVALLVAVVPAGLSAQHGGGAAPVATVPPREASQYDFLLGEWDLTVKVPVSGLAAKIHGVPKLVGTWKVTRALDGWGVEDDLKVTDQAGNPRAYTHSVRVYDAAARKWNLVSVDVYRGRITIATGEWRDGQLVSTSQGTDLEGKSFLSRTRIYDITSAGFKYQQDKSLDNGKQWQEGTLTIEARRASAPR